MKRRGLIAMFGGTAALRALPARAQQTQRIIHRIGVLTPGSPTDPQIEALRAGLRDYGYINGETVDIDWKFSGGSYEPLPRLARQLVDEKVDIIVAIHTPSAQAVQRTATSIPVVFMRVSDPVHSGLVTSIARPTGNMTGLTGITSELTGKRLQLLKEAIPGIRRVAGLYSRNNAGSQTNMDELVRAGGALGLELLILPIASARDIPDAIGAAVGWNAGALYVQGDTLLTEESAEFVSLANKNFVPIIAQYRDFAEAGALLTYGPNLRTMYRRGAYFVDRILKGTRPQDIPVEQPTKLELIINMKAARSLGLSVPPALAARANEVIE
jgi:putative ABC transport system substrate-binding protein